MSATGRRKSGSTRTNAHLDDLTPALMSVSITEASDILHSLDAQDSRHPHRGTGRDHPGDR